MIALRTRPWLLVAVLLAASACAGGESPRRESTAEVGGTLVIAAAGEPGSLVPPLAIALPDKQVVEQVFEPLAAPGPQLNTLGDAGFTPRLATRWTWSADSNMVEFAIDPAARFHDGRPVTAHDVAFSYRLFMDPAVASPTVPSFPALDSLVAADSVTVRAHFAERSPERFFKLVVNLLVMPRHLLERVDRARLGESAFAQQPVGSGPYRFVKWTRGASLELAADTTHAGGRPGFDRVFFRYFPDLNAATQSVVAGEADLVEQLRPEGIALVRPDGPARAVEYPSPDHGYLLFNTRSTSDRRRPHPLLGDRSLRIALAMAINRPLVIRNALDSLARVSYGPFVRTSWAADTTIAQIGFDTAAAKRTLDSLGWRDGDGDGVRERNGRPLRFSLLVPSVSATRRQMAVVLQEQLRQVGAAVTVDAQEPAVLGPRLGQGKFDAFIHVWHEDATPSAIAQAWGGTDLERSLNFGWYANPVVDSVLALAVRESDVSRARALYRQVYERIVLDAPAVFLWEQRTFALIHKRIRLTPLRPDAWWSGIPEWRVPVAERLPRDKVGGG
jgi:peptide/nickel transport system substrate-binding protein